MPDRTRDIACSLAMLQQLLGRRRSKDARVRRILRTARSEFIRPTMTPAQRDTLVAQVRWAISMQRIHVKRKPTDGNLAI